MTQDWQIQPATATNASCCDANFCATLLQQLSNVLKLLQNILNLINYINLLTHIRALFTWERSIADTRRIRFDNANDFPNGLRWESESGEHTANRAVATRDIRIRSEVNVQHGCIGTFNEHSLAIAQS